jgi:hypothetical protein
MAPVGWVCSSETGNRRGDDVEYSDFQIIGSDFQ